MRMANNAYNLKDTIAPTRIGPLFDHFRTALRRWRERERLRAQLIRMTDRELRDIGMTREEIDYINILAANRALLPPF
jgi:uncharacterized protein YjiS (DUF1127 family)